MTLEEQIEALNKAQMHYEKDIHKEGNMTNYTPVEKNDFASKGLAGTALGLGILGSATGLLNGNGLGGLFGNRNAGCPQHDFVTQAELSMSQQLASKDAEIGLLKADKYTDQKLTEVYTSLAQRDTAINARIDALKDQICQQNLQQATLNATQTANITCIEQQIAQMQSLFQLRIPNTSICPGWGNVTITPSTTATTTTA